MKKQNCLHNMSTNTFNAKVPFFWKPSPPASSYLERDSNDENTTEHSPFSVFRSRALSSLIKPAGIPNFRNKFVWSSISFTRQDITIVIGFASNPSQPRDFFPLVAFILIGLAANPSQPRDLFPLVAFIRKFLKSIFTRWISAQLIYGDLRDLLI